MSRHNIYLNACILKHLYCLLNLELFKVACVFVLISQKKNRKTAENNIKEREKLPVLDLKDSCSSGRRKKRKKEEDTFLKSN